MFLGAGQNDVNCIELIADHKTESFSTDINAQDKAGKTALHICAEKKCFQCAAVLLKRGAYLNVKY
jgi:ankyrin repeat protein